MLGKHSKGGYLELEEKKMKWFAETNYGRDIFLNIVMEFYYIHMVKTFYNLFTQNVQ